MSESEKNPLLKLYDYVIDRLERTIFFGLKFAFPKKFVSPLGFLGVLTAVVFLVLGITGGLLMLFYIPTAGGAFDSIKLINDTVPYGFLMRNIHYHASNAMVFLAVIHLYYQFFSGRFKIKYEVIWISGFLLGVITVLEAFFGYDLILNERAMLAVNIGASLNNAAPILGPLIKAIAFGSGFQDVIVRLYAFHAFILPMVMVVLMLFHFPRAMVLDIPMVSIVVGGIMIVGGLFPIELGVKFDPNIPPGITVPEWYLTMVYAFLRTGLDKFFAGILIPTIFFIMWAVIPYADTSRKFDWRERPFFTALGITSIGQAIVGTYWGFYVNPNENLELFDRLFIQPVPYFATLVIITGLCFGLTYASLHYINRQNHERRRPTTEGQLVLSIRSVGFVTAALIGLQVLLNYLAVQAFSSGFQNLALFEIGTILVVFGFIWHLYRYASGKPVVSKL